ncbi:extracellular catalytic domain type 1 short-chain-length polyhydroxyalkanoate depolymerase [Paraburkholderia caballeronis]|uniref:Esterase, PHB depolymerase family n=1 Tax=Paraburkholderia caballeronis TaxID=416943 RepID=A0A1H7TRR2_9BURK|nr:PHB depolymerase family esterase [Paraburkholderia caballeronis]PXW17610.1 poly(hydroxyalkanoate) depolymerase family esterase [Paraburkholderia caballeronis]PXW95355.1 poly(hydroxyalkanoate) depolymerase family esterase [Paraburkholderia caballeronis]RAJ91169.1 poly(hydroxyalkanoate) depolymerase family esterase [Paraburkholderia caballeronis]SEE14567.1 esterase, PHB depolymerase family [Paraburkholderia caballeronis]SEL87209.1 esterase, PHB depolymerase family [Paraburkholderia caballeron
MPRKKTSVWFRGLNLFASLTGIRPKKKAVVRKTATVKTTRAPATKRAGPARGPRPSSTRTMGRWTRSFHSAPPLAGKLVNHLAYALYLPSAATSQAAMPLVVMLHGCKQTAESFAAGTRICRLAERAGFAVLLPEQAKAAHAHRCWNWHEPPAQSEAPAVASLVVSIVAEHGFDHERVYLAGISAGAGLAAVLGVHYPALFAAVGLHSGPVFGAAHSTFTAMHVMRGGSREDPLHLIETSVDVARYPGMPAIIVHGELDAVVAKRNAEQLSIEFARLNRLIDAEGALRVGERRTYSRDAADYVDYLKAGRLVVRVCIVRGLGHAWSGGDPREAFHSGKGPEATAMMWNFFRHQRRVATHPV